MNTGGVRVLAAGLILLFSGSPGAAVVHFRDGGVHNIDYKINDDVLVDYLLAGAGTTVNVLAGGGTIHPYDLRGYGSSIVNVLDGSIASLLTASDRSQVTLSGGSAGSFLASGNSQVTLSGGFVENNLQLGGSAHANILGGRIGEMGGDSAGDLRVDDNGTATISGGQIERVSLFGRGSVIMEGGLIGYRHWTSAQLCEDSSMLISGGTVDGIHIRAGAHPRWYESSVLTISGPSLRVNGSPVSYGVFYSLRGELGTDYRITGYLDSGDYINTTVQVFDDSQLVIIPEPGTVFLVGVGGIALLRRRRQISP